MADENQQIDEVIDASFIRWSTESWMFDRYVPKSAHVGEKSLRDGSYLVRGMFDFIRFGAAHTISFAAAVKKGEDGFAVLNLCYIDTTSGTADCTNPPVTGDGQDSAASTSWQSQNAFGPAAIATMLDTGDAEDDPDDSKIYEQMREDRREEEELEWERQRQEEEQEELRQERQRDLDEMRLKDPDAGLW